jgi:hypothetical protein
MSLSFSNPRGDLPTTKIQRTSSYIFHLLNPDQDRDRDREHRCSTFRHSTTSSNPTKSRDSSNNRQPCYDWIFSSASNVHVAIDRSSFKTYAPFKSYVLTVSDYRQIPVLGIGTVDLDLRRKKGSRQCHTITLENVLHVPSWMCNVFSDVYFEPVAGNGEFEHEWGREGVQFMKRKEGDKLRTWGYTEEFSGLDRLVLARSVKGRSPMAEDAGREIFSVNLNFPQSQRDRWERVLEREERRGGGGEGRSFVEKDGNLGRRSRSSMGSKG